MPAEVTICEVGPRDGLQNDDVILPVSVRAGLGERLDACGRLPAGGVRRRT